MKSEIWIARDKPMHGATVGDVIIYGHKPYRDEESGVFIPKSALTEDDMTFYECCDSTDMIVLNAKAFPEVTWENSPQRLTLTKETDWLKLADI